MFDSGRGDGVIEYCSIYLFTYVDIFSKLELKINLFYETLKRTHQRVLWGFLALKLPWILCYAKLMMVGEVVNTMHVSNT